MNPHYTPSWRWGPTGRSWVLKPQLEGVALENSSPHTAEGEASDHTCGSTPGMAKGQGLPVTAKLPMSLGLTVPCRALYKGKLKLTETLEEAE